MMLELQKELRYGLRNGRFLILMAGFLFFAMLTPVTMKFVLPGVMQSQIPGLTEESLAQMFHMDQLGCIQGYMGDVLEIGALLAAFSLCGLMAQELRDNTLVLPLCAGKRFASILGAKVLVFGAALMLTTTAALSMNYLYAGVLYAFDIGYLPILLAGLLQGLFMAFMLEGILFFGAVLKKPIAAGFVTLGIVYVSSALGGLLKIGSWLPTGLMEAAAKLNGTLSADVLRPVLVTAALMAALHTGTLIRLRHMEWNQR